MLTSDCHHYAVKAPAYLSSDSPERPAAAAWLVICVMQASRVCQLQAAQADQGCSFEGFSCCFTATRLWLQQQHSSRSVCCNPLQVLLLAGSA